MNAEPEKPRSHVTLFQLIPNMMTVAAICAGLSAIRFGVQGNYVLAVQFILAACVLDGLDGRLARLMRTDSRMGAELDSLADFLNFGVAPPIVLYFWTLQDLRGLGWISVLVFAVCCVLRLARFNVAAKAEENHVPSAYFMGVPSPAGALLAMWPMFVSLAFADRPVVPDLVVCANLALVGLAMISHVPVWSFKTVRVSRENAKFVLVGAVFLGAALFIYPWITMTALCLGYMGLVAWCAWRKGR
jgi:CDP-diacylglycerol--serine O-phosphatidyltransferase